MDTIPKLTPNKISTIIFLYPKKLHQMANAPMVIDWQVDTYGNVIMSKCNARGLLRKVCRSFL